MHICMLSGVKKIFSFNEGFQVIQVFKWASSTLLLFWRMEESNDLPNVSVAIVTTCKSSGVKGRQDLGPVLRIIMENVAVLSKFYENDAYGHTTRWITEQPELKIRKNSGGKEIFSDKRVEFYSLILMLLVTKATVIWFIGSRILPRPIVQGREGGN